jgi:hypothetical protein
MVHLAPVAGEVRSVARTYVGRVCQAGRGRVRVGRGQQARRGLVQQPARTGGVMQPKTGEKDTSPYPFPPWPVMEGVGAHAGEDLLWKLNV